MGVFEGAILEKEEEFWKRAGASRQNNTQITLQNRLVSSSYVNNTYSKAIQPVMKIVSSAVGNTQVNNTLLYVARERSEENDKLTLETDDGQEIKGKDAIQDLVKEWGQDFLDKDKYNKQKWKLELLQHLEEKKEGLEIKQENQALTEHEAKRLKQLNEQIKGQYIIGQDGVKKSLKIVGAKDTTHIIFSIGGVPSEKAATEATRNFLQENFAANGFKYAFVKHNDTDNLHYHLVVKNKNVFEKRLRFDKADLFILRQEYARHLSDKGIERVSTLRMDREEVLEKAKKNIDLLKGNNSWYQQQLAQGKTANFNAFVYRANLTGKTQKLIERLAQQVVNSSGQEKKEIKQDLQYLKSLKKELQTITPEKFEAEKEATIKNLSKTNKELLVKIKNVHLPSEKRVAFGGKKHSKKYLNNLIKEHRKDLKAARDYVIINKNLHKEKAQYKEIINYLNRMIKATKSKELTR
jgi:hypothetical protein